MRRGDIYAPLDSIESDDEGKIENVMNDSDSEFVAEDETVISINDSKNEWEEHLYQNISISVPEASIYVLSMQSQDYGNETFKQLPEPATTKKASVVSENNRKKKNAKITERK